MLEDEPQRVGVRGERRHLALEEPAGLAVGPVELVEALEESFQAPDELGQHPKRRGQWRRRAREAIRRRPVHGGNRPLPSSGRGTALRPRPSRPGRRARHGSRRRAATDGSARRRFPDSRRRPSACHSFSSRGLCLPSRVILTTDCGWVSSPSKRKKSAFWELYAPGAANAHRLLSIVVPAFAAMSWT